jgi:hypothetical protein
VSENGYLPGFSADICISYSHLDNHHTDVRGTLWVDNFHLELQALVSASIGHPVTIWRDTSPAGSSELSEENSERLRKSGVLLAIVSPAYVHSGLCKREREVFIESRPGSGALENSNSRRIISAYKLPVAVEELPEILALAPGFQFYSVDQQNGRASDYLFDPRPEAQRLYFRTLSDLAHAIADLLRRIRYGSSPVEEKSPGITVYLAETTSDLVLEREAFRRELEARGCVVVPRQPLSHDIKVCPEQARADLAAAKLSFHFLGKHYGLIPEGGKQSLVELQTEIAAERSASGLKSVVWIPRGLQPAEDQQRALLERVRNQRATGSGVELLETSFEELKTFLVDLLENPSSRRAKVAAPAVAPEPFGVPQIYLVRDKEDREGVAALTKYLFDQGLEVIIPADEGEEGQLRQNHQENLKICDGVMIWWGSTKKIWLDYMMRDLDRARGLGRNSPFRAKAVCIGEPVGPEKADFMTHKAQIIRFMNGFAPEPLLPLVEAMKSTAHA